MEGPVHARTVGVHLSVYPFQFISDGRVFSGAFRGQLTQHLTEAVLTQDRHHDTCAHTCVCRCLCVCIACLWVGWAVRANVPLRPLTVSCVFVCRNVSIMVRPKKDVMRWPCSRSHVMKRLYLTDGRHT